MKKRKQSAGGRLAVMTVDQLISGGSNVLISVLAARLLGATQFGLFGIVFLLYVILIGVTRALVSDPLLVHPVESRERPGEAIGTNLLLAVPLAFALAAVAVVIRFLNASLGDALIVLAVCLPLLALQDAGRYLGFATQRPKRAVVLDSVWLLLMFVGIGILLTRHGRTLASFVAVWGGSGAAAGVLLFFWYGVSEVRLGLAWLKQTWSLAWRYLVSYASWQGAALGMSSEVGAIAGTRALAGLQGTLLLVRPFNTFSIAAVASSTSEIAHRVNDRTWIWRHTFISSGLCSTIAAINMAVMIVLPTSLGHLVLGDTWHLTKPLVVPAGLNIVFLGLLIGPQASLYGVRAMREVMTINVATAVLMLIGAGCGAAINGALGALWGVAMSQGLVMVASWITFATVVKRTRPLPVEAHPQVPSIGLVALLSSAARSNGTDPGVIAAAENGGTVPSGIAAR